MLLFHLIDATFAFLADTVVVECAVQKIEDDVTRKES